jgi:glycosyltransferase involved in cell wall biosynthesis
MPAQPLVSVITATYNRANVLRYAIESVRHQTLTDWEMWVVGDGCTDETADMVREIGDPRVQFYNLPQNAGDQSVPNNEGFRRSRGRFIAYLNHDDLWFPDHLEAGVRALEETGADLVWPLIVKLRTDGIFTCNAVTFDRRYAANLLIPASFWILRREMLETVGPWRFHRECYATPSQDWLFRAFRAGKQMRQIQGFTAIALPSGGRPNAYANRDFLEHRTVFERMQSDPRFRETALLVAAEYRAMLDDRPSLAASKDAAKVRFRRWVAQKGIQPEAVELAVRYGRKGNFVRFLRSFRGIPLD